MMNVSFLLIGRLLLIILVIDNSLGQIRIQNEADDFCYAETEKPYLYFSSKTAYNAVTYRNDVEIIPSECRPVQLWMLVRHGARFPMTKKMEAFHNLIKLRNHIVTNHEKHYRGELCDKDLENLKAWSLDNIPLSESDRLTHQGYVELKGLGDRIWHKFNDLFKESYSEKKYKVQYTNHDKTRDSAEAFMTGIFGRQISIPKPTPQDLLTLIKPDCEVLPISGSDDPPDLGKNERSLFKNGRIMKKMILGVSKRLGFKHSLSIDEVENMYDMCRYKKSWAFEDLSPWCACFTGDDLKIMEYTGDLSYYYNSGHGYSGNLRTGCPLVHDMVYRFRDIVTNRYNDQPNAVFYFGHSTTMYNLYARLGLAKDDIHLTHDNYYNVSNRKWRTSQIGPFSANFGAALLKCDSGIKHRAVFYHNESPLKFSECHGYVCSWETIEDMLGSITSDPLTCNFNFCEEDQRQDDIQEKNITVVMKNSNSSINDNTQGKKNTETETSVYKEDVILGSETEIYNGEITEGTLNSNEYKILSRKVNTLSDSQEINSATAEKEIENKIKNNKNDLKNMVMQEINSYDDFKHKPNFTDSEINLSWLFISVTVIIIVLGLCHHYTKKRKLLKGTRNGYERMSNSLQLKNFQG